MLTERLKRVDLSRSRVTRLAAGWVRLRNGQSTWTPIMVTIDQAHLARVIPYQVEQDPR